MKQSFLLLVYTLLLATVGYAQTVNPPIIRCVNNINARNNIEICIDLVDNSQCAGGFIEYRVFGGPSQTGPFTLVGTVTNVNQLCFTHIGALLSSNEWFYYVEVDYNCPTPTTSGRSLVVSNTEPGTMEIVAVSVENGEAVITWKVSDVIQTSYYSVSYYLGPNTFDEFDQVSGRFDTTLTDTVQRFDPNEGSVRFIVNAFDSCGNNQGNFFATMPHRTIYMTDSLDRCNRTITLEWNKYINWPEDANGFSVGKYEIYWSRNQSPFSKLGEVGSDITSFKIDAFSDFDDLEYFVRAVSAVNPNVVSNSNRRQLFADIVQPPSYFYIESITVIDSMIKVSLKIDPAAELMDMEIFRSKDSSEMREIEDVDFDTVPGTFCFIDSNVNIANGPFYYNFIARDSCSDEYSTGIGRQLFIRAFQNDFFENQIDLTNFIIPDGQVVIFRIYRDVGNGFQLYRTIGPNQLSINDDLSDLFNLQGTFCYYVEAEYLLSPLFQQPTTQVITSNTRCIDERPVVYIPNAFMPESNIRSNKVFKPTLYYADVTGYTMQIYNKSGKLMFETFDENAGWDGTDDGKNLPSGGYAYYFRFNAVDGTLIEKKGVLILIR